MIQGPQMPKISAVKIIWWVLFGFWTLLALGCIIQAAHDNETVGGFIIVTSMVCIAWLGIPAAIKFIPWEKW